MRLCASEVGVGGGFGSHPSALMAYVRKGQPTPWRDDAVRQLPHHWYTAIAKPSPNLPDYLAEQNEKGSCTRRGQPTPCQSPGTGHEHAGSRGTGTWQARVALPSVPARRRGQAPRPRSHPPTNHARPAARRQRPATAAAHVAAINQHAQWLVLVARATGRAAGPGSGSRSRATVVGCAVRVLVARERGGLAELQVWTHPGSPC